MFVGALAGLVAAVLFSLIALAVGAHKAVDDRTLKWADVGPATIIFSVLGAFFASVIGAWVAAKMSGARRAEPAILHGVDMPGYVTLIEGDAVRTGVTGIHPRGRAGAGDPVAAGFHSHGHAIG